MEGFKGFMICIIRRHWHYEDGVLEKMSDEEVREIFERLLDWIEE